MAKETIELSKPESRDVNVAPETVSALSMGKVMEALRRSDQDPTFDGGAGLRFMLEGLNA